MTDNEEHCKSCALLLPRVEKLERWKDRTEEFKERFGKKLDRLELHNQELLNQQIKQSGSIALLTQQLEQQTTDREEKHKTLLAVITEIKDTFKLHTDEEMHRYKIIDEALKSKASQEAVVDLQAVDKDLEVVRFFSKHPKMLIPLVIGMMALYLFSLPEIRKPVLETFGVSKKITEQINK